MKWLVSQFPPSDTLGLIWDAAPSHGDRRVKACLNNLEAERRLYVTAIPGGLTSILQVGDLVLNGPCKKFLRKKYLSWQFSEIERRRNSGQGGRLTVKINRELLMSWCEMFVEDFNIKENSANILLPCLTKVGQNCFDMNMSAFNSWLESLNQNALYKSLLEAHTAFNL